ncbi:hypothetical protein NDU88_005760 [Pleurodeles waltl]|uniref:Uncharacterized protein n=1 Tax=Pleurodeles waltl TaxID=8319 RepID=A0AAV7WZN2_PLEWA|nr:hypothetical protein NDU88_005760 [Pleurodeles waltl]
MRERGPVGPAGKGYRHREGAGWKVSRARPARSGSESAAAGPLGGEAASTCDGGWSRGWDRGRSASGSEGRRNAGKGAAPVRGAANERRHACQGGTSEERRAGD